MPNSVTVLEMVGRLILAIFLGGLIGLEREWHSQPAGLRTHMIVAIGAALMTLISLDIGRAGGSYSADPGRVAAQIVSGIGFLGAGAILRFGISVKGLTTAACLWTAAGIGMAVGMGYYIGAVVTTALVLLSIFVFDKVEKTLIIGKTYKRFVILMKDIPGVIGRAENTLEKYDIIIKQVGLHKDLVENKVQVTITAQTTAKLDLEALTKEVSALEGVEKLDID